MADIEKMEQLSKIMGRVHALADHAWPLDDEGCTPMPVEAERLIIDIQEAAAKALGLPEGLYLMTGNTAADLDQ